MFTTEVIHPAVEIRTVKSDEVRRVILRAYERRGGLEFEVSRAIGVAPSLRAVEEGELSLPAGRGALAKIEGGQIDLIGLVGDSVLPFGERQNLLSEAVGQWEAIPKYQAVAIELGLMILTRSGIPLFFRRPERRTKDTGLPSLAVIANAKQREKMKGKGITEDRYLLKFDRDRYLDLLGDLR